MPSVLPEGDPAPADGSLPAAALAGLGRTAVRASTCTCRSARCGAATATSTPTPRPSSVGPGCARSLAGDVRRRGDRRDPARPLRCSGAADVPVGTVFFGGGTPTLLPPDDLVRILAAIDAEFGLADDAEVTTESNPDSVDRDALAALREGGFNRISFGMQSAVPHVLAVLDRTHDPRPGAAGGGLGAGGRLRAGQPRPDLRHAGGVARRTGGPPSTPRSAARPDHVSAYALIVEEGTALARQVRRGRGADARRRRPGRQVRRWPTRRSARPGSTGTRCPTGRGGRPARCRHNLGYWTGGDWWGVGPGAHSHVGGVRWWNVKHPAAYAARHGGRGVSPAQPARCSTTRPAGSSGCCSRPGCASGLPAEVLDDAGRAAVPGPGGPRARGAGRPGRAHHAVAGCSPTPWCATCCPEPPSAHRRSVSRQWTRRRQSG